MITALLSAAALAQASDLAAPPQLYAEPRLRASCVCRDEDAADDVVRLEGLVVDAEVTLGAGGRAANDRQATVFDVSGGAAEISGRTRIWHSTRAENCGVTFDYGRKYRLAARRTEEGLLETDECLMRRAGSGPDR